MERTLERAYQWLEGAIAMVMPRTPSSVPPVTRKRGRAAKLSTAPQPTPATTGKAVRVSAAKAAAGAGGEALALAERPGNLNSVAGNAAPLSCLAVYRTTALERIAMIRRKWLYDPRLTKAA